MIRVTILIVLVGEIFGQKNLINNLGVDVGVPHWCYIRKGKYVGLQCSVVADKTVQESELFDVYSTKDNISMIDFSGMPLNDKLINFSPVLNLMPGLKILKLANTGLTTLPKDVFKTSSGLIEIYLDHNKIEKVDPDSFKNLTELQFLDLKSNRLKDIPQMPSGLVYLDISDNEISSLSLGPFEKAGNLKVLNVCRNPLQKVDHMAEKVFPKLAQFCTSQSPNPQVPASNLERLELEAYTRNGQATRPRLDITEKIKAEKVTIGGYEISSIEFIQRAKGLQNLSLINSSMKNNVHMESAKNTLLGLQELILINSPTLASAIISVLRPDLKELIRSSPLQDPQKETKVEIKSGRLSCTCVLKMLLDLERSISNNPTCLYLGPHGITDVPLTEGVPTACEGKTRWIPQITSAKPLIPTTPGTTQSHEKSQRKGVENNSTKASALPIVIGVIVGGFIFSVMFVAGFFYLRRKGNANIDNSSSTTYKKDAS